MTKLIKYEAARQALAAATHVDEVKDIRDKAIAMQTYAKQAQDYELIGYAIEIRLRAERRAGELLHEMEKHTGGRPSKTGNETLPVFTLAELGISKMQSHRWQKLAELDEQAFETKIAETTRAAINTRAENQEEKQQNRIAREQQLASQTKAAIQSLGRKLYNVIYADPPWRFEPYSRQSGMDRSADNHYPTLTLDALLALRPPSGASCALFLWATAPMMPQALEVMAAWGFQYKSQMVWVKNRIGTGYWFRNQHELLLVGTKGQVPAPAAGDQPSSVLAANVLAHSVKPDAVAAMIEKMFPTVPKLEMFARENREGWDVWGNEVKDVKR